MVWFYSILAGILCTVLVNPMFWKRCISALMYKKKSKAYFNANPDANNDEYNLPRDIRNLNMDGEWEYESFIGGIIAEIIWFLIGSCFIGLVYFLLCLQDVGFLSMLSWICLPAIFKFLVWFFLGYLKDDCSVSNIITMLVIFVLSLAINVATPIYEFNNPKELTVSIIEPEVPTISVDISETLDKLKIADDTTFSSPVYRNGEVIYVVESGDSYTESPGYVSVKGDEIEFVENRLKYNPYVIGVNNVTWVARQKLPDKIFFGNGFSFQKDEEGNIYYACLYGTHPFLRAGKNIEGMVYVNASTGDITICSLEEIPSFMTGISQ